jgi:predicted RNA-binding protein associated with RNAse of E/G family
MTMAQTEVTIEYIRPGKDVTEYIEDLIFENEHGIKTFKIFPKLVAEKLTQSLQNNGFISKRQRVACITKIYFFRQHFNVLQFQDKNRQTLGFYSDIGTSLIKTEGGYRMTDWFLDIWLSPSGKLFELDMDEFEEALSKNLISSAEAQIARETFARLIDEVKQGIYPHTYIR